MKRVLLAIAFFGIFTAIFSTLFFVFIDNYTTTRWISYGMIHLAWAVLILNLYRFPEVNGGVIFGYIKRELACAMFLLEFALGILFIIINNDNYIFPLLCQAIPFGIKLAKYVAFASAEHYTKQMDKQDKANMAFIKEAGRSLQGSIKICQDWKLAKKIESLLDDVKSSQIKCIAAAAEDEMKFLDIAEKINKQIISGETENVESLLREATVILDRRNSIIKAEG